MTEEPTKIRRRPQKPVILAFLVVLVIVIVWIIFANMINKYSESIGNPIWSIIFNVGLAILLFTLPYFILKKGSKKQY